MIRCKMMGYEVVTEYDENDALGSSVWKPLRAYTLLNVRIRFQQVFI